MCDGKSPISQRVRTYPRPTVLAKAFLVALRPAASKNTRRCPLLDQRPPRSLRSNWLWSVRPPAFILPGRLDSKFRWCRRDSCSNSGGISGFGKSRSRCHRRCAGPQKVARNKRWRCVWLRHTNHPISTPRTHPTITALNPIRTPRRHLCGVSLKPVYDQ